MLKCELKKGLTELFTVLVDIATGRTEKVTGDVVKLLMSFEALKINFL